MRNTLREFPIRVELVVELLNEIYHARSTREFILREQNVLVWE